MPGFLQPTEGGKLRNEVRKNIPKEDNDNTASSIEKVILRKLGRPKGFLKMETKLVGNGRYRVNIVCEKLAPDALLPSITRPYSYYVVVDKEDLDFRPNL